MSDNVPVSRGPAFYKKQSDEETQSPKEECTSKSVTDSRSSEKLAVLAKIKEEQDTERVTDNLRVNKHLTLFCF